MGWLDRWHDPHDLERAGSGPRLLLATFGRLFWYFPATQIVRVVHEGRGKYYGVASSGVGEPGLRELLVVSRPDQEKNDQLLRIDQWRGKVKKVRPLPSRDTHQAVRHGPELFVVDTFRGNVHVLSLPGLEPVQVFDGFTHENHVNSVLIEDDHVLVLCHNKGESELVRLDRASGQVLHTYKDVGEHSHDIVRWRDDYLLCDSRGGRLITVERESGAMRALSGDQGNFTKGLIVEDDIAYFATSQAAIREKRHAVECELVAFDLRAEAEIWRRRLPTRGLVNQIFTARGLLLSASARPAVPA